MDAILDFLAQHWIWLGAVLGAVLVAAAALVKLTKNTVDDWIVGLLQQGLGALGPMIEEALARREQPGDDAREALPGTGESLLVEGERELLDEDAEPSDLRLRR